MMAECWSIVEQTFRVETNRAYEGLFALGSGYLHVRGSLEEHLAGAPQDAAPLRMPANVTAEQFPDDKAKWGTYVPGIFGDHPFLRSEMINLPFFCGLAPLVAGERLDMETSHVEEYRRELFLRTAELARTLCWCTAAGARLDVTFERFVSAARPKLCVQRLTLVPYRRVTVVLRAGIDANVRTNAFDHFETVELSRGGADDVACRLRTNGGDDVHILSRLRTTGATWAYEPGQRRADLVGQFALEAGEALVVEKRTAVATSRDLDPAGPADALDAAAGLSYDELRTEHAVVWYRRWEAADVVIEGDDRSQLALRASIYHLLRAHVPGDDRVAIDAKGYAGEGYMGRYFWDTEMCLLPFYLYTDPAAARTLVGFRVRTFAGAVENARSYGYPGARYAWESDALGRESCACWQYRDHEVHVTADVAYGLAHYAAATGERDFLRGDAAKVLVETARYWLARADPRPGEDHLSLLGVMGPDEYCPISHNNSYTNALAALALALAAEHGAAAGAEDDERRAFAQAAAKLPFLRRDDGLILQCEDFDRLAEPRFDLWRDRSRPYAAQVSQERLYRSKCLKQADVLLLMMLLPGEFTDEQVRQAWDYYVPLTTHDSSLSPGVHAIVAMRLGLVDQAWAFWQRSAGIDLDVSTGGPAEGIHIAAAGNNWQMAVFGFAGLASAMQAEVLTLRPQLPRAWSRLAFPLLWRDTPVTVEITHEAAAITNRGDAALEVCVHDERRAIESGRTETFRLAQGSAQGRTAGPR